MSVGILSEVNSVLVKINGYINEIDSISVSYNFIWDNFIRFLCFNIILVFFKVNDLGS